MKKWIKILPTLLTFSLLLLLLGQATYSFSNWQTLKTKHFTVFYQDDDRNIAREVLGIMEYHRHQIEKICGYTDFNVPIVIDDYGTMVMGFSDPVSRTNHLGKYAPNASNFNTPSSWWSNVGVHEYTHHLTFFNNRGFMKTLSNIFGRNIMLLPNAHVPLWLYEGLAVYNESQLSPFQGRLNSGLFDAYIAAQAKADKLPSLLRGSYEFLPFRNGYIYGSEFLAYLAKTYGEEKITRFLEVNGENGFSLWPIPAWNIDNSAQKVFGKSFPMLWQEWQLYEKERFHDFQMEGKRLTQTGWLKTSLQIAGNKVYFQKTSRKEVAPDQQQNFYQISTIDLKTGKQSNLLSSAVPFAPVSMQTTGEQLYYGVQLLKTGFANASGGGRGAYCQLHRYDLNSGRDQIILSDEIRGYGLLRDQQIIYSVDQKKSFGSVLYQYDPQTAQKTKLFATSYLVDRIIANEKYLLAVARTKNDNFNIYELDLRQQQLTPLLPTPFITINPTLKGEKLFFAANFGERISAYCYDLHHQQLYRLTEKGYADNPVYDAATGDLYYLGLTAAGYDLYRKPAEFQEYYLPDYEMQAEVTIPAPQNVQEGGYGDNLSTLWPRSWTPIFAFGENSEEFGFTLEGNDVVGDFPIYKATFVYDLEQARIKTSGMVQSNYFAPLVLALSYSNVDDPVTSLNMAYPFYTGRSSGVQGMQFGTQLDFTADYQYPVTIPYLQLDFGYPTLQGNISLSTPLAKRHDNTWRKGFYLQTEADQYLLEGNLAFKAGYYHDLGAVDSVFPAIRGYEEELMAQKGIFYSLEYTRLLTSFKSGFWNPTFYFNNLYGSLFGDYAKASTESKQWVVGAKLEVDGKIGLASDGIPVVYGLQYLYNKKANSQIGFFIKSIF